LTWRSILLFSLLSLLFPTSASAQNPESHLLRGDMFYFEGDYYRAITEYKTFLMKTIDDPRSSRVDMKIAWIYSLADRPKASEALLRHIALEQRTELEGWWARLYSAHVAMESENRLRARRAYESIIEDCEPIIAQKGTAAGIERPDCLELTTRARLGLAQYWTRQDNFDRAARELASVPKQALQAPDARKVAKYVDTLDIPQKNPAVAGALSIVPGLGHFYLEEWGVGIVAMVWNGAFLFATVDSFVAGRVGQGTLLGLLELVWYAGTIWGAVSGAHRFNRDAMLIVREGLTEDIDRIAEDVPWPARFPVQYPTGLQLEFEW
jgi:tetratricopeptide (TPR) repeat protein